MERARCLFRGVGPEKTSFAETADAPDQTRECFRGGTTESTSQLRRWKRVLDRNPEEPGMLDCELPKHRHTSFDQVRGRVISRGQRRHTRAECVERACAKRDQEALLGIVNTVHSPRTRPDPPGHSPN